MKCNLVLLAALLACTCMSACSRQDPMHVEGVPENQHRGDIVSDWAMRGARIGGDLGDGGNIATIRDEQWQSLGHDERRGVVAYLAHWAWMRADVEDTQWPDEILVQVNGRTVATAPVHPGQSNELREATDRQVEEATAVLEQMMRRQ